MERLIDDWLDVDSVMWTRSDAVAFRAMYERLRRFAGVVGPWEVEPEDLLQEALLRTLQTGPLSRLNRPEAYLKRTIINLASNHRRRRHLSERSLESRAGTEWYAEASYPSDLSDLLSLDPVARAVVFLHDIEGYPFADVAETLELPEGTCRQIASRARRRLRDQLEQEVDR